MTQVADAAPAPPPVPKELVPTTGKAFLVGQAKGVQIYKCSENPITKAIEWTFVAPRATLKGDNGQVITHSVGPIWAAPDGSQVTAKATKKVPDDQHFVPADAKDIQQLLLEVPAKGATGGGLLGATTFIQRLNTKGGTKPPNAECKVQTVGKVKEVPYQADYVFFKAA
jgi:hypothetical protein